MKVPPILANKLRARKTDASGSARVLFPSNSFSALPFSFPDGDGINFSIAGKIVPVRLFGVDAPEWGQRHAKQSWLHLQSLVWGRLVNCFIHDRDRYGRLICECYAGAQFSLNLMQVLYGFAWYSPKYAPDALELRDAQRLARMYQRGLWQQQDPTPPWIFRHSKSH